MKQRVGFARALVVEPEVLFMDEPFSALDVLTAENLRSELLELWLNKKMPTTATSSAHHIEEAVLLADRVIVLAGIRGEFAPTSRLTFRNTAIASRRGFWPRRFIYKTLTRPDEPVSFPAKRHSNLATGKRASAPSSRCCLMRVPAASRDSWSCSPTAAAATISNLADELAMDVDDLLPIVDASVMLGFAVLNEVDVEYHAWKAASSVKPTSRPRSRSSATLPSRMSPSCGSSRTPCMPSATMPSAKSSSATSWTSISAPMKSNASSRPL